MSLHKSVCKVCILHNCPLGQRHRLEINMQLSVLPDTPVGGKQKNKTKTSYIGLVGMTMLLHCYYIAITLLHKHMCCDAEFPMVITLYSTLPQYSTVTS